MKKRLLSKVLFLVTFALLVVACSKDDDDVDVKTQKVAVLLPDASIVARWAVDKQNLETVMNKYGFNATFYTAPENEDGAALQVEQIKKAIADGSKYIVITAIDYKKINESGLLGQYPNVKVVCHDRFILDNPDIAYISSADTKEVGRMQALFLLNHFHSSGAASMTLELLAGPETDMNAKDYYEGAMALLKPYIDNGSLVVRSGKKDYSQTKADSWTTADGKKAMLDRLASYGAGECPDMVLSAADNLSQGAIEALTEAGFKEMPVITGQDNSAMSRDISRVASRP